MHINNKYNAYPLNARSLTMHKQLGNWLRRGCRWTMDLPTKNSEFKYDNVLVKEKYNEIKQIE